MIHVVVKALIWYFIYEKNFSYKICISIDEKNLTLLIRVGGAQMGCNDPVTKLTKNERLFRKATLEKEILESLTKYNFVVLIE